MTIGSRRTRPTGDTAGAAPRSGATPRLPRGRLARLLPYAALFAAAVAFGGCSDTTEASTKKGPSAVRAQTPARTPTAVALHLDAGDYTVTSSSTTLHGTATRGARVTVNGRQASMHGGRWSATLSLRLGTNGIAVRATLAGRRAARGSIVVTREKSSAEIGAEARRQAPTTEEAPASSGAQPPPASSAPEACTNGTYVNSAGNTVCRPEESPTAPAGATAECADGTYSFSESRSGTCSHHGGVVRWLR